MRKYFFIALIILNFIIIVNEKISFAKERQHNNTNNSMLNLRIAQDEQNILLSSLFNFNTPQQYKDIIKDIHIKIGIRPSICWDTKYPLLVEIENQSTDTILYTEFRIDIREPNSSKTLVTKPILYKIDDIIAPKEKYSSCWRCPPTIHGPYDYQLFEELGLKYFLYDVEFTLQDTPGGNEAIRRRFQKIKPN